MQHGVRYRDRAVRENADTRRDGDRRRATSLVTVQLNALDLRKGAGGGRDVPDVPARAGPHCRNLFHGYRKHANCGRYQKERSEGTRYHLIRIYLFDRLEIYSIEYNWFFNLSVCLFIIINLKFFWNEKKNFKLILPLIFPPFFQLI